MEQHLLKISQKEDRVFRRFYQTGKNFAENQFLGKGFVDALAKQIATFLGKDVSLESWRERKSKKKEEKN
jgi:hypothetical protein